MKTAILYWGSKGGAVRQIQNYMHAANDLGLQITWCLSSNFEGISEIHDFTDNKILLTQIPAHKLSVILNLKLRNSERDFTSPRFGQYSTRLLSVTASLGRTFIEENP